MLDYCENHFSHLFVKGIDYTVMYNYKGHVNHNLQCNNSALHLSVITSIIRNYLMVFRTISIHKWILEMVSVFCSLTYFCFQFDRKISLKVYTIYTL